MARTKSLYLFALLIFPFGIFAQSLTHAGDKTQGLASYYGQKFNGRKTASGERFSVDSLTAAHPRLPFGSLLKVTHLKTGDTVVVRVNDRGPFVKSRILDLSDSAAKKIGLYRFGVSKIEIELLHFGPVPEATNNENPNQPAKRILTRIIPITPVLLRNSNKRRPNPALLKPDSSQPTLPTLPNP